VDTSAPSEAWDAAARAAEAAGVSLRRMATLEDADRVLGLIERTWGGQALPRETLRALEHADSGVIGATQDGEDLVGFVLGFIGMAGGLHVHSHMLAVTPDRRRGGVGFALKLAQRAAALEEGVEEVRWTYDPLLARNAWFNLMKLGAAATEFLPDFYGEMNDLLNADDRSDRFEVRWRLREERVRTRAGGAPVAVPALDGATPILERGGTGADVRPVLTGEAIGERATVAIPQDYPELRARRGDLAVEWRSAAAEAFEKCFAAGLSAAGLTRDGVYVFETAG
jgi:predicted GNAT superfamily acetyltransferase